MDLKEIVESLISTFIKAGDVSLDLRKKGLIKKIKSDNTPVSNGDLEVNKIILNKISEITPDIPIVSEETTYKVSSGAVVADATKLVAGTKGTFMRIRLKLPVDKSINKAELFALNSETVYSSQ